MVELRLPPGFSVFLAYDLNLDIILFIKYKDLRKYK